MKAVFKILGWIVRFALFILFTLATAVLEGLFFITKWLRDVSRPN